MHKAYRLQIPEGHFESKHISAGRYMCFIEDNSLRDTLSTFIMEDGNIDGGKLSNAWFPKVPAEVFISHSHADTELAYGLAGWLFNYFGIESFIDSTVWGHYDHLLELLCKEHAPDSSQGESYKANLARHIHLMLASALSVMMDKTECVIFIHSENSVIENNRQTRTKSPWLLHEVQMMRLLRQLSLSAHRQPSLEESLGSEKHAHIPEIHHQIDLTSLPVINENHMLRWKLAFFAQLDAQIKSPTKSLDWLYKNVTLLS